jgi:hypothetical protein
VIELINTIDGKDVEFTAVTEDQAELLKRSGWKRKSTTHKAASAKNEEKS